MRTLRTPPGGAGARLVHDRRHARGARDQSKARSSRAAPRIRRWGSAPARALIESPDSLESFDVRAQAPDVLLFANLGAVQLNKGYAIAAMPAPRRIIARRRARAASQPAARSAAAGRRHVFSRPAAPNRRSLRRSRVSDRGQGSRLGYRGSRRAAAVRRGRRGSGSRGRRGTSWSEVERHRIAEPWRARVAGAFAGWGIPTARCLIEARRGRAGRNAVRQRRNSQRASTSRRPSRSAPTSPASPDRFCARRIAVSTTPKRSLAS